MIRRGESGWVDVRRALMVARWGCDRVAPQVSTGNRTRATIGTYPSCLALIRPGNEAAPLALRAQPGRKEQRCCAASASHSGKT
jgi:hypothetical protein